MALRLSGRLSVSVASWPVNSRVSVSYISALHVPISVPVAMCVNLDTSAQKHPQADVRIVVRGIPSLSSGIKLRPYTAPTSGQRILIHKRGMCILRANLVGHGEQGAEARGVNSRIGAGFFQRS